MTIVASWFLILVSSCLLSQEPTEIVLGGPRKVVASIETDPDSYLITVRMRAVQCFDATTNRKLNQQKASLMVRRASDPPEGEKTEPDPADRGEQHDDGFFIAERRPIRADDPIPKRECFGRGSVEVPKRKANDRQTRLESPSDIQEGNFFTRKQDHLDTLEALNGSIVQDLLDLRGERASPGETDRFYSRIADFEEAQVTRLASLRREVEGDRLLLNLEQEEILAQINRRETEILHKLSDIVKSWERQVKQSKKEGER